MKTKSNLSGIERRDFLKILSLSGAAVLIRPADLIPGTSAFKTRVVIIEDQNVFSNNKVDKKVVRIMIDEGIKALTGFNELDSAWKSIFPGINESSRISIKANAMNPAVPTHPELVYSMAESIQSMNFGGNQYQANNIIIFDRSNQQLRSSKYTLNTSNSGVRCLGNDDALAGYDSVQYDVNGTQQRVTKILTDMSDFHINAPVLKNHYISGITLSIKNHFGTVSDPNKLHPKNSDPYAPAMNNIPPIKNKQKFFIIDAILGIISGGPYGSAQVNPNKIIMGTDICAVDYEGKLLLESLGCLTTGTATHIATAAKMGLGTDNPDEIEIINIKNPSAGTGLEDEKQKSQIILQQNTPNPFSDYTNIRFYLPSSQKVNIEIFDLKGNLVITLLNDYLPSGWNQLNWAGKSSDNILLNSGNFICRFSSGSFSKSIIMQLMR